MCADNALVELPASARSRVLDQFGDRRICEAPAQAGSIELRILGCEQMLERHCFNVMVVNMRGSGMSEQLVTHESQAIR